MPTERARRAHVRPGAVDESVDLESEGDARVGAGPIGGRLEAGPPLRRSADPLGGSQVDAGISAALRRRAGSGAQLPAELSGSLGEHYGQDFSSVRVHADPEAGKIAGALQSHAFTHGNDLYFAPGKFKPGAPDGQRLIAHELGHVVAQRTGADSGGGAGLTVGNAHDPAEAAADRAADGAMSALRRKASDPAGHQHGNCDCAPVEGSLRRSFAPLDRSPLRRSVTSPGARLDQAIRREVGTDVEQVGNTFEGGTGKYAGTKKENEKGVSTTTHKAVAGAWGEASAEKDEFNGKTHRKGKAEASGVAGAEAYIALIKTATEEELSVAYEACARAGVFGKAEASGVITRGPLQAGGEVSIEGGVGVSAGSTGKAKIDRSGKIPKLEAALTAFAKAGAEFDFAAMGFVGVGPAQLIAKIEASGFAGAKAEASGSVKAGPTGVKLEGEASAMAGAQVEGTAAITVKLSNQEVTAALAGEAFAGVKASVGGKIAIGLSGIEVSGKAEAFAGVSAEATGSVEWTHKGRTIFAASGTVTVDAGAGGKVEGTFTFKNGKLKISFGAKAVLGVGFGADVAAELDFIALGQAIYSEVNDAINRSTVTIGDSAGKIDRQPVVDRLVAAGLIKRGYEAYISDFRGYASKKLSEGQNGIKKERVQEILDFRRGQIGMDLVYGETDQGITKAAVEAFGPLLKSITISGGTITSFLPAPFTAIEGIRKTNTKDTTLAAFRTALSTQVGKVQAGGKHLPDTDMITKVIGKHYSKVSAARTPEEADTEMATVVEEVYAGIISGFTITGGVPGSFKFDAKTVQEKDSAVVTTKADNAQKALLAQITQGCAVYAAKKAGQGDNGIKSERVAKIIADPVSKLRTAAPDDPARLALDGKIAQAVKDGLGSAIRELEVSGGTITVFSAADAQAIKAGDKNDKAAAARQLVYAEASKKFAEYAAKKAVKGTNGVKPEEIQAIVTAAFKKVGDDPTARAEADATLTEKARLAFGDTVNHLKVTDGQAVVVVSQTKTAAVKEKTKSEAARVGSAFGEEDGNKRRYNVRHALYDNLSTYFTRIRANPRGVPTLGEVQTIVSKGTAGFRSELAFDDAKAELMKAISDASEGYFTVRRVDDAGTLSGASADMTALMALRGKDGDDAKDEVVLAALRSPLASYAKASYKKRPTLSTLQAVVDKAKRAWAAGADTATPVDELIAKAIAEAFAERIKECRVEGGMVTVLRMAS
ncbi:protein of unknown function [Nakamurella panacisegetis]|uniref:eCIS core domain-containing protein n=1 Tax=Nakamurella panacisegetis TaxID=1090615 RepID=A0A1H0JI67_9ACTN|nr:DUF4157 domain-containing protein [Nakamurella panacisegetis]SDO43119.1 protein of unknown function [Nakamurella panacisegetis]